MTENDNACLVALHRMTSEYGENQYFPFRPIERITGLSRKVVRVSIRRLARSGLAEYSRALTTEDGMVAGAGYAITRAGYNLVEAMPHE